MRSRRRLESDERADWLALFSEAAISLRRSPPASGRRRSSGGRARIVGSDFRRTNPAEAGSHSPVDKIMRAVEACLLSVNVPEARELAAEAIDALERGRRRRLPPGRGHVASGWRVAFRSRRTHRSSQVGFDSADGVHADGPAAVRDARRRVDAAGRPRALRRTRRAVCGDLRGRAGFCRLAALHHDDEYRRTAVLAVDTDYVREATQTLEALAPSVQRTGRRSGAFRSRTRRMARSAIKSADHMSLDRATLIPALKNVATRLRIDSLKSTSEAGSGHPTSCCSAAEIMAAAVFRRDAVRSARPAAPGQRSLRAVERPRGPDSLRGLGRSRRLRPRGAAELEADRFRPRRPPDAAVAVRRRGDRFARAGHLRGDRHRAERAADQVGLPDLRAARRRRIGRRLGVGSRGHRLHGRARQPVRDHRRQRPRPEPRHDVEPRHGSVRAPLARVRVARDRRRRTRSGGHSRRTRGGPAHERQADDDPGPHDQGQGRVVRRRQGRVARQGVQEGRGARSRAGRARRAVRARASASTSRRRSRAAGGIRGQTRSPNRSRRRPTRSATRSRPAKRTARRSPNWASPTPVSSRSTPT